MKKSQRKCIRRLSLFFLLHLLLIPTAVAVRGDVDGSGSVDAVDVQLGINEALGIGDGSNSADLNADGNVNAVDVQLVINAALGINIDEAVAMQFRGQVEYKSRDGSLHPGAFLRVVVREHNGLLAGDDDIVSGLTKEDGSFLLPEDDDDTYIFNEDTALGESGRRDIYLVVSAENDAVRVHTAEKALFSHETTVAKNVQGTDVTIDVPPMLSTDAIPEHASAFGIPAVMWKAHEFFALRGMVPRPLLSVFYGPSDTVYDAAYSYRFANDWLVYEYVTVPENSSYSHHEDLDSRIVLLHEYGHAAHVWARGADLPGKDNEYGEHYPFTETDEGFALTEAWADFFARAVEGDPEARLSYTFQDDEESGSLEQNNYWMGIDSASLAVNGTGNTGEIVEGAVASILWDLFDPVSGDETDDDQVEESFEDLWTVFMQDDPDAVWYESGGGDFYHYWIGEFGATGIRPFKEILLDHGVPVTDDLADGEVYALGYGNDTREQAYDITPIEFWPSETWLIVTDPDWYQFAVYTADPVEVAINIDYDRRRGRIEALLYEKESGDLLDSDTEPRAYDGPIVLSALAEPGKTYLLNVVGAGDIESTTNVYEGDFCPSYTLDIATAPPSSEPWSATFGGPSDDSAWAVTETPDGGFLVAGSTSSFGAGGADVYLVKIDTDGNKLWTRTFGGTDTDFARDVITTADGGFALAGSSNSFGTGGWEMLLLKTDALGYETWNETFGWEHDIRGYSVLSASDGGYVIAGNRIGEPGPINERHDVHLVKTDASGSEVWTRTIGPTDRAEEIFVGTTTPDGGYAFAGSDNDNYIPYNGTYILKTDAEGYKVWSTKIQMESFVDEAHGIASAPNGAVVVAGIMSGPEELRDKDFDLYILKTAAYGTVVWNRRIGGNGYDWAWAMTATNDGGYVLAGMTRPEGGSDFDMYVVKTDADGIVDWSKTFGGSEGDIAFAVTEASDGSLVMAGKTKSFGQGGYDMYVVKTDAAGNTVWSKTFRPDRASGSE